MRVKFLAGLLAFVMVVGLTPMTAWAARQARVEGEGATLFSSPSAESPAVTKLPKGTPLAVSNLPTQGYYKARTKSGDVGWVSAEMLTVYGSDGPPSDMPLPPAPPTEVDGPRAAMAAENTQPRSRVALRVRGFGGMGLFTQKDFAGVTGFEELTNGFYGAGEVQFAINKKLSMDVRVEAILKSSVGQDTNNTNRVYQFDLFSMPVMMGLSVELGSSRKAEFHLAALAGIALSTSLTSTANVSAPNETVFSTIPFVGVFKADYSLKISGSFWLMVEAGYRELSTKKLKPSTEGNGSDLFEDTNNEMQSLSIDMSGPFVGAGVGFTF